MKPFVFKVFDNIKFFVILVSCKIIVQCTFYFVQELFFSHRHLCTCYYT